MAWTEAAWSDHLYWQGTLTHIDKLITKILRTSFKGIGKPEALKENPAGFWSRRLDDANRLVYATSDSHIPSSHVGIITCAVLDLSFTLIEKMVNQALHNPAPRINGRAFRAEWQRNGLPIGHNDLWAGRPYTRADGWILVANNEREFVRVPGLQVENRITSLT